MTENPHPAISFRITGYRSISGARRVADAERLSSGRPGHWSTDHHLFPDGSFEPVKAEFPVGSMHAHMPPPPCRYEMVFAAERDMAQEKAQLGCQLCHRPSQATDNRKAPGP